MNIKEPMTLTDLLEQIAVEHPVIDCWQEHDVTGWHPVADENGIIAYFGSEIDAYRFRLDLINRRMNP